MKSTSTLIMNNEALGAA